MAEQAGNGGTKDVETMMLLKYISNFWTIFEMPLINCKISLQFSCSKKSIIVARTAANQVQNFRITDTKPYVPVISWSSQDNIKLLKQLDSSFKRTIN